MPFRLPARLFPIAAASIIGCSYPGEDSANTRRAASQAYNEATAALASRDYSLATSKFTAAIDLGGLNPDLYADACLKRAICHGASGKYDEALAELNQLESAGLDRDKIYAARSYVLAKQGKAAE